VNLRRCFITGSNLWWSTYSQSCCWACFLPCRVPFTWETLQRFSQTQTPQKLNLSLRGRQICYVACSLLFV